MNRVFFIVAFRPDEVAKAITYLEIALEEERKKNQVPFEQKLHLFARLNLSERDPHVRFGYKDLRIGIYFLEFIIMTINLEGRDVTKIENMLCELKEFSKATILQ